MCSYLLEINITTGTKFSFEIDDLQREKEREIEREREREKGRKIKKKYHPKEFAKARTSSSYL